MFRRLIVTAAAAATLGGSALAAIPASASIIGDPGVYLNSTPTLTLAAPNAAFTKDITGRAAILKTCKGDGNCAASDNLRVTEQFDLVTAVAPSTWTGTELRLHGTQWCVTNRGTTVFYSTCHAYASQRWTGTGLVGLSGVLTNTKTGLNLDHTALQAYAPVAASTQLTHWGNSS
jgi:hypothetical protein